MQAIQVFHIFILISLTTSIEAQEASKPRCRDWCAGVDIPYPFGIGRNCSFNEWYNVDCKSTTEWYNPNKLYLPALNNAEVVTIRSSEYMTWLRSNTITVKMSGINANCSSPVYNSNLIQTTSHTKSPFAISGSSNVLVFKGCGNAAIMEENGNIIAGCSTTCETDTVSDLNNCFGVGCCKTTIPHDLYSFTINLTGLEGHDRDGTCGSAFLVDTEYAGRFPSDFTGEDNVFVPISFSWNDTVYESRRCNETCGEFGIPYPFGIERSCSISDWYVVDCNSSTPYLSAFNNMEVLGFGAEYDTAYDTVTVNVPTIYDCNNPLQNTSILEFSESPFFISISANIVVVEGCGNADVIADNGTVVVGGCSSTCGNGTVSDINNCFGVGCCRTAVPLGLESFAFNLTGLEKAGNGACGSALWVDRNSILKGIVSRQFVPITLGFAKISVSPCRECESRGGVCNHDDIGFHCQYFHESGKKSHNGVILGVSISMGSIFVTVISYALYRTIKKTTAKRTKQMYFKRNGGLLLKQQEATNFGLADKTILFTSSELEKATDSFNKAKSHKNP